MSYERLWERLLESLNEWATAVEVEPGRVQVALATSDGSTMDVEILMTHQEWDNMVTIPWGDFDLAVKDVRKSLLGLRNDQRFLIFGDYELVPSETRTLPVDPDEARLHELARQHPAGFGRWVAFDDSGNVGDEFQPPSD